MRRLTYWVLAMLLAVVVGYVKAQSPSPGLSVSPKPQSSGGGGTPANPNTSIQFNNSGAFGGSANLTWNNALQIWQVITQLPNIDGSVLPAPVLAGAGAGNLSNGVYSYKFTQVDNAGNETAVGAATATVTVVDFTTNGQIIVPLPDLCTYSPIINVYRTHAGGATYNLQSQQNYTCASSFTDNVADASLTTAAPSANTTALTWQFNGSTFLPPDDTVSNQARTIVLGDATQPSLNFVGGNVPINTDAGSFVFSSGTAYGTGNGGAVTWQAGNTVGTGNAGNVFFQAGKNQGGGAGTGGLAIIQGGSATGSGVAGDVSLIPGQGASAALNGNVRLRDAAGADHIQIQPLGQVVFGCLPGVCTGNGQPILFQGDPPTVANVGANSCGTTAATVSMLSNDYVGEITVGATSGTQCRLTFQATAVNRRNCSAVDETTVIVVQTKYVDTTHSDFLGVFTAGDVVSYQCSIH